MTVRPKIVGLGEVLWDVFPDGPRFGGAPANFACHAAMLGGDSYMASQVGRDELGDAAIESLQSLGVNVDFVRRDDQRPTGTVQVQVDAYGKPTFEIMRDVAWDRISWSEELAELARTADAVCFGTLAQRSETSRATIRTFLEHTRPDCLRVFDVNFRPPFVDRDVVLESLPLATVLKLNDDELPRVADFCGVRGDEQATISAIRARYGLKLVALTRGERGAMLVSESGVSEQPGCAVQIADTVGAGDAFTAAMTLLWLKQLPLDVICERACRVAAYVCSQPGGTPRLPDELRELISDERNGKGVQ